MYHPLDSAGGKMSNLSMLNLINLEESRHIKTLDVDKGKRVTVLGYVSIHST